MTREEAEVWRAVFSVYAADPSVTTNEAARLASRRLEELKRMVSRRHVGQALGWWAWREPQEEGQADVE